MIVRQSQRFVWVSTHQLANLGCECRRYKDSVLPQACGVCYFQRNCRLYGNNLQRHRRACHDRARLQGRTKGSIDGRTAKFWSLVGNDSKFQWGYRLIFLRRRSLGNLRLSMWLLLDITGQVSCRKMMSSNLCISLGGIPSLSEFSLWQSIENYGRRNRRATG